MSPSSLPSVHLIQVLLRDMRERQVKFLLYPHPTWRGPDGTPFLVLPTDKTVAEPDAAFRLGESLEAYVDALMAGELGLRPEDYALEQELPAAEASIPSVHAGVEKHFVIFPLDVWVAPAQREPLRERLHGVWLTASEALVHPQIAPSAKAVFFRVTTQEQHLDERYRVHAADEHRDESPHRLLKHVAERPSMYALARRWFAQNKAGTRLLRKDTLDEVLASGGRAFNLRVADPYLRYQMQGVGFTWSFFTHKDAQDVHVHSAPTVEIYGVLEGRLEVWWKPYHDRGTSAWSHAVLGAGDWLEVEALQCHYVRWQGEGKGVVFKAGPGPLAEVGRLGVAGKTCCANCICMKPEGLG